MIDLDKAVNYQIGIDKASTLALQLMARLKLSCQLQDYTPPVKQDQINLPTD